jgi:Arm DNA-binding domain/Phage integrase central domain
MPRISFTDRTIRAIAPATRHQLDYFDEKTPGFGLRVTPAGHKSWVVLYKREGRLRRMTLGKYPALSLADARSLAKATISKVALGEDPATDKKAARLAETFGELAHEYLERHAKANKRSWREDERILDHDILPAWRHMKAKSISRRDVRELLDAIVDRGAPIQANRTFALIRKIFNFALQRDIAAVNPCHGLQRPAQDRQRDRVLTMDEIRTLWSALDNEHRDVATRGCPAPC